MPTKMKDKKLGRRMPQYLPKSVGIDDDFEEILISAERYSLGRMTYVVSDYVWYVTPLVPYLSDKTLDILLHDLIDRSMRVDPENPDFNPWGMPQDEKEWKKLWKAIEDEQKRRVVEM